MGLTKAGPSRGKPDLHDLHVRLGGRASHGPHSIGPWCNGKHKALQRPERSFDSVWICKRSVAQRLERHLVKVEDGGSNPLGVTTSAKAGITFFNNHIPSFSASANGSTPDSGSGDSRFESWVES